MKSRIILAAMLVGAVGVFVLTAGAQQGSSPTDDSKKVREDVHLRELVLSRQFAEFEQAVLKLKQRLERSGDKEDKERAVTLQRVLDAIREGGIGVQFDQLVQYLKDQKLASVGEIRIANERAAKLADELRLILALMREDSRTAKLAAERRSLEDYIKQITRLIREQQTVQLQTQGKVTEAKELGKNQEKVTKDTNKLAKQMEGKLNQGAEAKQGSAKDGGKTGNKGEAKDVGKSGESKGETKEAGKDSKDKPGDKAAAKPGDQKSPSEPKPGEAKAGEKGGEPKGGEPKGGEAKSAKGGDAKPGEGKEGGKPSESKQGEAKAGDSKGGQGEAKEGGQKPPDQAGQKGPQDQGNKAPKDDVAKSRKQVQDAEDFQKKAENEIAKRRNEQAVDDQEKAIDRLKDAKEKLEKLLRQLREEELERLLGALKNRCEKMLAMQIAVYHGTEGLYKVIEASAEKKPRREDQQGSLKLSDNEKDIVSEATKAIEMLEAEGSAVAFPEVFQQVREDMKHVQRRLEITDVGIVTQAIEKDIIDSLKEMIEALKKAQQELDNKKNPPPPDDKNPKPNPDQKLLDQIAELKMIRSLQMRVNTRTETYGKMYVPKEGEQTADPAIRRELHNLSDRQVRIFEVTNKIARGDNK